LILPIAWKANYRTAYPVFKNIKISNNIFRDTQEDSWY